MDVTYYGKEVRIFVEVLDGLYRIASNNPTVDHRIAFGRKFREAFSVQIPSFRGSRSLASEWIRSNSDALTLLGDKSRFFESLAGEKYAQEVILNPTFFNCIDPARRVPFAFMYLKKNAESFKTIIDLVRHELPPTELQRFILGCFRQYAGEPEHKIWQALKYEFKEQAANGDFWRALHKDELTELLEIVARAYPGIILETLKDEVKYFCTIRCGRESYSRVLDMAVASSTVKDFENLDSLDVEAIVQSPSVADSPLGIKPLCLKWRPALVLTLATFATWEVSLRKYTLSELATGLRFAAVKAQEYRAWQYDLWPIMRMRRWCLRALAGNGFTVAPVERYVDGEGQTRSAVMYRQEWYSLPPRMQVEVGTRVIFSPSKSHRLTSETCYIFPEF